VLRTATRGQRGAEVSTFIATLGSGAAAVGVAGDDVHDLLEIALMNARVQISGIPPP
jgi:hypothetical protein